MRRAASVLPVLAIGLLLFAVWMHPAVLAPTNVGWLLAGEDRGQSALGLAAYLRADGPWPGLHQPLLAAPEGMTLLFTDSIPLLGVILKPFASWLPREAQYIGLWYLSCCLLQAIFAWLLVRRHTSDPLARLLGTVLLAAMPALFNRYGHASLCAQWLVLWALWIFVDPVRSRRPLHWAAVLSIAALVHSYLLIMIASFWGSAVLRDLVRGPARGRALAGALVALAPVVAIAAAHGVIGGHYASTRSYGSFPMALDAWWNPANPTYTVLLPSSPDEHAMGFEGLQYLGAGLLALAVLALALVGRGKDGPDRRMPLAGLAWLAPAFLVLLVVAIGPEPLWRGHPLFSIRLPVGLVDALDPVRAAGRLVWPLTYTLAYAAIAVVSRWSRATLALGVALALQIVDLLPMLVAIHGTSAAAEDRRTYLRTLDPRWEGLVAGAAAVEFEPAEAFRDLQLMEEVAWRAVRACRPVRYFYASREERGTRARIKADAGAFRAGRLDPTRLYVLLDGKAPPALLARVRHLDGVAIIPPTAVPPPPPGCPTAS